MWALASLLSYDENLNKNRGNYGKGSEISFYIFFC